VVRVDRFSATGMELKSLVYSRSPLQADLHTQQRIPGVAIKTLIYSRFEHSASSKLEGTSFVSNFRSDPSKLYASNPCVV